MILDVTPEDTTYLEITSEIKSDITEADDGGTEIVSDISVLLDTKDTSYQEGATTDLTEVQNDVETEDIGPSPCYQNNFNNESDLSNLVKQNGVWSLNPNGYLQQTEFMEGGWRMAYLDMGNFDNFEATIRVRMIETDIYGIDQHTGLLFRYTKTGENGYDENLDKGYILEIEKANGTNLDLTLEDVNKTRLFTVTMDGFVPGEQYNTWYELKVKAVGNKITAYFEGQEMFSLQNDLYSSGKIGFGSHATESHFDDLEVCEIE